MNSWNPFGTFPREMGFPNRSCIVNNLTEFLNKINQYNGKCTIFTSLYPFNEVNERKPNYETSRITHLFFDLDHEQGFENANKLHTYLVEKKIKHTLFFSGGGFHIYVACQYPNLLKNKRVAIANAVDSIAKDLNLTVGVEETADIDAHTVGNIAQLVRVPNTYNIKRQRFCIPLFAEDLSTSLQNIKELAKKQRLSSPPKIYGEEYFNIEQYDGETRQRFEIPAEIMEGEVGLENINVNAFPDCMKKLLGEKMGHKQRFYFIAFCKEQGIPLADTVALLEKYLPKDIFYHCVKEENQPITIYSRADLIFPSCSTLQQQGYCKGDKICHL